jgi:hypothetical protein
VNEFRWSSNPKRSEVGRGRRNDKLVHGTNSGKRSNRANWNVAVRNSPKAETRNPKFEVRESVRGSNAGKTLAGGFARRNRGIRALAGAGLGVLREATGRRSASAETWNSQRKGEE